MVSLDTGLKNHYKVQIKLPKSLRTRFTITLPVIFFSSNLIDGCVGLVLFFYLIAAVTLIIICTVVVCLSPCLNKGSEVIIVLPYFLPGHYQSP